jgi:hypothetical protein
VNGKAALTVGVGVGVGVGDGVVETVPSPPLQAVKQASPASAKIIRINNLPQERARYLLLARLIRHNSSSLEIVTVSGKIADWRSRQRRFVRPASDTVRPHASARRF